jgi:excisionase family DNA binding protein
MSPSPANPPYIKPAIQSVREASTYLGIPVAGIYDLIALGEITAIKRGQRTGVVTASMDAYVERLPKAVINLSKRGAERLAKLRERAEAAKGCPDAA